MITETTRVSGDAPASSNGATSHGHNRALAMRRRLPGGRALVGGLLVAVAAVGAIVLAGAGSEPATVPVVVAANDIDPGDLLGPTTLRVEQMALPEALVASTYPDATALDGTVARYVAQLLASDRGAIAAMKRSLNELTHVDSAILEGIHARFLASLQSDALQQRLADAKAARR